MAKLSDPCVKVEHMAAVFDINTGFRSSAVATIDAGLETITVAVATLGPTEAVAQLERAQQRQHCATVTPILQNAGVIFRLSSRIATFRAMLAIRLGFAAQLCVACVTGPHQP